MLTIAYIHINTWGMFNNHTACSLYGTMVMATSVMGVMKMGNLVPRAEIECTSLAFRASVLSITPSGHRDVTILLTPMPTCLCNLRGQCRLVHLSPLNCKPVNDYIHTGNDLPSTYTE